MKEFLARISTSQFSRIEKKTFHRLGDRIWLLRGIKNDERTFFRVYLIWNVNDCYRSPDSQETIWDKRIFGHDHQLTISEVSITLSVGDKSINTAIVTDFFNHIVCVCVKCQSNAMCYCCSINRNFVVVASSSHLPDILTHSCHRTSAYCDKYLHSEEEKNIRAHPFAIWFIFTIVSIFLSQN